MRKDKLAVLCMLACLIRDASATAPICGADGTSKSSGICRCDGISRTRTRSAFSLLPKAIPFLLLRSTAPIAGINPASKRAHDAHSLGLILSCAFFWYSPVQSLQPSRMSSSCPARTIAVRSVKVRGIRRARERCMRVTRQSGACRHPALVRCLHIGGRGVMQRAEGAALKSGAACNPWQVQLGSLGVKSGVVCSLVARHQSQPDGLSLRSQRHVLLGDVGRRKRLRLWRHFGKGFPRLCCRRHGHDNRGMPLRRYGLLVDSFVSSGYLLCCES